MDSQFKTTDFLIALDALKFKVKTYEKYLEEPNFPISKSTIKKEIKICTDVIEKIHSLYPTIPR